MERLNGISLLEYMNRSYQDMTNRTHTITSLTILHIFFPYDSHQRKDKKIFQTESQYRLAGMTMMKLIHSDNLNAADEIFTHTVKIFDFETALSDLIDSVNFILEIGDFNEMPIKTEENTQFSLSNEDHDTDHAAT